MGPLRLDQDPPGTGRTHLLGEQLFTQGVEGDELPGQQPGFQEALGHQHDLTDQLEVGHHHRTGPGGEQAAVTPHSGSPSSLAAPCTSSPGGCVPASQPGHMELGSSFSPWFLTHPGQEAPDLTPALTRILMDRSISAGELPSLGEPQGF